MKSARRAALPWQRKRRRTLLALGLCLMLFFAYFAFRVGIRQELQAALDAYQATGAPLTLAELDSRWYTPDPAAQALGQRLSDALGLIAPLEPERVSLVPYYGEIDYTPEMPLDPAVLDEMERVVAENEAALDLLHELLGDGQPLFQGATSQASAVDPGVALGLGPTFLEGYRGIVDGRFLHRWASFSKLLRVQAFAAAARQDDDAAIRASLVLLRLAETLREAPFQNQQRHRRSLLEEWVENLGQILSRCEPAAEELSAIEQVLAGINLLDGAERVLQGDYAVWMATIWPMLDRHFFARITGALDKDRAGEVAGVTALQACYALPPREAEAAWRRVYAQDFAMRTRFGEATRPAQLLRVNALLDSARVAIALVRFRQRHGSPPARLEELVPEEMAAIPEDLFTGSPLLCKQDGDRWSVYSVSMDAKDDGGLFAAPDGRRSAGLDAGIMIILRPRPPGAPADQPQEFTSPS